MFGTIKKEFHTLSAAINPRWNWRTLRPVANLVVPTENLLPQVTRDFMSCAGKVVGGTIIVYGGALNDLANNQEPKDYDCYCLTDHHPLVAMYLAKRWAQQNDHEVIKPQRRVRLLWKQLVIKTEHGKFDITFLQGKMPLYDLVRQLADEADVSPCARSATVKEAFISQRCIIGENKKQLIFRPSVSDRDRFRHFDRWLKYAIAKYPDRPIIYQSDSDAGLYSPLSAQRAEIKERYNELQKAQCTPKRFGPFRHMLPGLYDYLQNKAEQQLIK